MCFSSQMCAHTLRSLCGPFSLFGRCDVIKIKLVSKATMRSKVQVKYHLKRAITDTASSKTNAAKTCFSVLLFTDVTPVLKLIPKPKEPLLSPKPGSNGCVRCAVVGTGGILNGSKMGAEIDAHDYVFRMNGAITQGYEEDVGNRTSVYVHTAHSITTSLYLLKKYGYQGIKYVMIPEGQRDYNWATGPSGFVCKAFIGFVHDHPVVFISRRFLKSKSLNRRYWAIFRPTNGAFAIFLALQTWYAYGFMTKDYMKYSNYYVERGTKTKVTFYSNHDYILEKGLWHKLHNSTILKLYQRTSETEGEKPAPPLTRRGHGSKESHIVYVSVDE
uniref:alpha-N-acetylgalactosaminide alpha-2,6-sialyltransferase n=1 Tax=Salarias fasciatus TaxID=181472 RepID=A0A672H5U2_SALFA